MTEVSFSGGSIDNRSSIVLFDREICSVPFRLSPIEDVIS